MLYGAQLQPAAITVLHQPPDSTVEVRHGLTSRCSHSGREQDRPCDACCCCYQAIGYVPLAQQPWPWAFSQAAGLDVGWGQRISLAWDAGRRAHHAQRSLLPGRYQYKMIFDGRWSFDADHPLLEVRLLITKRWCPLSLMLIPGSR